MEGSAASEIAKNRALRSDETLIRETVNVRRGKRIRLVGHKGGTSINLDIHSGHDVTCAEIDQEAAQRLVHLLGEFLRAPAGSGEDADAVH